jgi:hypothetical protein
LQARRRAGRVVNRKLSIVYAYRPWKGRIGKYGKYV